MTLEERKAARAYAVPTNRERQVIALIAQGKTNKEVAADMGLTEGTVKVYVRNLRSKFGFTRYDLIKVMLRDEQRVRAVELNNWIQKWKEQLTPEAMLEIRGILAKTVPDILQTPNPSVGPVAR